MARLNAIHVACALNDYYLMPYGVMLVSLFENNKSSKFHTHVFSGQMNDNSIRTLESICKSYNSDFTFYQLKDSDFSDLVSSDRISYVTYYRDVIPQAIIPEAEKILYLDGDMIVVGDITELWNTSLDGFILGAADDLFAIKQREFARLNIPEKYGYFNSGTFLINRKEWIKNNTTHKIFDYSRKNKNILKYLDQDAENYIMHARRKVIDQKWNQQVAIYFNHSGFNNPYYSDKKLEKIKQNPVIVHFNGIEKPWEYVNLHPFKKNFNYYLDISGLERPSEKLTPKKVLKKMVYKTFGWAWWNRI